VLILPSPFRFRVDGGGSGGGGGTFGVVTRVTLETHELPNFFGAVDGSVVANAAIVPAGSSGSIQFIGWS